MTKNNGHQASRGGTRLQDFKNRFGTSADSETDTETIAVDDHERHVLRNLLLGLAGALIIAMVIKMLGGRS